jgi:hypothetical protein
MSQLKTKIHAGKCGSYRSTGLHKRGQIFRGLTRGWVVLLLLTSGMAAFSRPKLSEFDVKAAYLLNFGKFMHGANAESSATHGAFNVCVVGEDGIEAALKELVEGQNIDSRPVQIVRVKDGTQARSCQIAYVSDSEGARMDKDLEELRGADVLTVGDSSTFLAQGGMIQFILLSDHVRFAVNLETVKKTHLVLSSELLRVAYSISGMPAMEAAP